MTPHEQSILEHILDGGAIIVPNSDEPLIFTVLVSENSDNFKLGLDELNQCQIHHTPDQLTIIELKKQLANLQDKLKEVKTQKTKLGANLREANGSGPQSTVKSPHRAHLTLEEVREIEQTIKQDWKVKNPLLQITYGISQSVAWHIRHGKHGKSSSSYIQHLKDIKQYRD